MNRLYISKRRFQFYLFACLILCVHAANANPTIQPPPNWSVDPADYEFNMNAVIRVNYVGNPANQAGNLLGAFVGNELRGVATPLFFGADAYYFITYFSNQYFGETVNFKVYYQPDDAIYPAFEEVTFVHNGSIGTSELPFWINIDPNADFPPELEPLLADTTLVNIPFESVDLNDYLFSLDGDPVIWSAQPGPNLTVTLINGVMTVTPVSNQWIGTDSVRIIVTENTPNQLADTITGWFTVLPDYGAPEWQDIPDQTIFQGDDFTDFDLDDYLNFNGDCIEYDLAVYPFDGTTPDPAWPAITPGNQPMTIIARPLFVDIQLAGGGSKLAAYVNGTRAAWATATGTPPNVTYQLSLKNVGAGNISFEFYDASNQYLYEESSNLTFVAGGSIGTVSNPYLLQLSPLVPSIGPGNVVQVSIDDPSWTGNFPVDFIAIDCDYPDIRRDTHQVIFSIQTDIRPNITSPTTVNFEENACYVLYDTQTSDPNNSEGNGLTYALDGGADAGKFSINTQNGVLSWAAGFSPDFENPQDADVNNQYVVNIKVTNAGNQSDVITLVVTVTNQANEPFAVSINGGTNLICTNASVNLTASGAVSYVWSTGSTQPQITVTTPGTYTVTGTSTGSCTATASIVIAPPPTISASGNIGVVCLGSNITLNSTPTGGTPPYASFSWTGPDNYQSNLEDPTAFPATANSGGTYTVVVTDTPGCTASGTVSISVSSNPAPTITAGSNSPVCSGANLTLNSTPTGGSGQGYTFLWAGPNRFGSTSQNPAPFIATLAAAGTYSVTVTDNAGCSGSNTTSVTVHALPIITASSNSPVSEGGTIQLSSTASGGSGSGYTYVWSGPNSYSSSDAQPAGFPATMAAAGVYSVTLTDGNGCTSTATTSVSVVACPTITASVSGAVCDGGTITLTSAPIGGALPYTAFAWAGPNNYSANVEDPAPFVANMQAAGTYTVSVTDALGCVSTASVSVTIHPNPSITAQNNGPICSGAQVVLTSSPSGGTPGYTFSWTGPDFFGASAEDPAPFTGTVASSGIYTVKVTDSKGCTATATTNLVVNPKPIALATNNGPLCLGATLDLKTNPSGGSGNYTSFNWAGPNSFSSGLENPKINNIALVHAGTYTVTVTDNAGCTGTSSTTLSISTNNAPTISAASNSPICAGNQLVLTSTPNAGSPPYNAFSWSGPNGYSSNMEDPTPFIVFLNGAGIYTVTVTDTKNCKGTASVNVSVFGPALAPTTNSPVCPGATLQLNSGGPSGSGVTYSWVGPNNFTSGAVNPTIPNATPAASGTYSVTVNDNGCVNSATVTASVADAIPPTITCPANTTLAADGQCSGQVGTWAPLSVSDNCNPSPSVTQTPAANTILSGHNDVETITLTANDGNGNNSSCNFTLTLKDVTPPLLSCPPNQTVAADANCNGVVGSWSPASLSDNCAVNPSFTQSPLASTALSGHNDVETVTLTANDGNGNSSDCSFTVTLKDVTPPTIICPGNTTIEADANCNGSLGSYMPTQLADNCAANPSFSQSPAAGTVLSGHNDVETVTLTADDGNGNTNTCNFTVTLKDVTKPTITCPGPQTLNADANCSSLLGTYNPVSVSDNCNANPTVTQSPAANTVLTGHNDVETVTLTANDGNGNSNSCSFTVTLKDVTPPSIVCPPDATVNADANCSGLVGVRNPVSVSDNCNANPTVTQSPVPGTVLIGHNDFEVVTLTANDGNGNTASCSLTVTLKDVTKPTITCPPNVTLNADANCSSLLGAYSAVSVSDNCNPNPTVTQSPAASTVLSGHNDVEVVTLTADDGNGNTQFCTFTVTLKDVTPPVVVCKPFTAALNAAGMVTVLPSDVYGSGSDNCGVVNLVSVVPNTFNCSQLGANVVVLTVNDGNGNTSSCNATVTVVDQIPPTMMCKNHTVALNAAGSASVSTADINNGSTDNCTLTNLSLTPNFFTCSNLGANTVTLTGTDQSGNTATCQATVTVIDNIPPTMLCRNATLNLNAQGQATLTVADVNNGSFDNCTIVVFNLSKTQFTCADIGDNTVTLSGRDQSNNAGSCTAIVTVRDLILPVALCKNTIANLGANGTVTVAPSAINNGSSDNCSFTLSLAPNTFNCNQLGVNVVTLTVTDAGGNTRTCTARVTVRDVTAPTALCKNITIFLNDVGKKSINAIDLDNGSTDNCSISTRSLLQTDYNCSDIGAPVNNLLTVKDPSGNTSTCSALVTVKDNIAPTPICKNTVVTLGSNGNVTVYPSILADSSFDNCSVTGYLPAAKTYNSAGIYNLVITVSDWSGNTATCVSVVTVNQNSPVRDEEDSIVNVTNSESDALQLNVYPNPTSGALWVDFELPDEQMFRLNIHDITGRLILEEHRTGLKGRNSMYLDVRKVPSGLYLLECTSAPLRSVKRLLIQH
ncbi:MAG TPA: hypothetical protein DCF33_06735 [Saprospirales bacterium]|nr:hypothetical protein [Saprospirales bacterium]